MTASDDEPTGFSGSKFSSASLNSSSPLSSACSTSCSAEACPQVVVPLSSLQHLNPHVLPTLHSSMNLPVYEFLSNCLLWVTVLHTNPPPPPPPPPRSFDSALVGL